MMPIETALMIQVAIYPAPLGQGNGFSQCSYIRRVFGSSGAGVGR